MKRIASCCLVMTPCWHDQPGFVLWDVHMNKHESFISTASAVLPLKSCAWAEILSCVTGISTSVHLFTLGSLRQIQLLAILDVDHGKVSQGRRDQA